MDDDTFHQMMSMQHASIDEIFTDPVFSEADHYQVIENCNIAALVRPNPFAPTEEGIQSASSLKEYPNSFVDIIEDSVLADPDQVEKDENPGNIQGKQDLHTETAMEEEYFDAPFDVVEEEEEDMEEYFMPSEYAEPWEERKVFEEEMVEMENYIALAGMLQPDICDEGILREMNQVFFDLKFDTEQAPRAFSFTTDENSAPKTLEGAGNQAVTLCTTSTENCSNSPKTLETLSDTSSISGNELSFVSNDELHECMMNPYFGETMFDCSDKNADCLWSILTTDPCYFNTPTLKSDVFYQTLQTATSKKCLFDAANYNKPKTVHKQYPVNTKALLNECYDNLHLHLEDTFDPDKHVSSTYLWTHHSDYLNEPSIVRNDSSWFPEGNFKINIRGETTGHLLDGTPVKVRTLIDSGATKPMLNKKFYDKTPFLHAYPVHKIKPRGIRIANDQILTIEECVTIMINFGGHVFEMTVYLIDMSENYDFVIGQKTMYELEGGPHFGNLNFHFMMRSIPLNCNQGSCAETRRK